LEDYSQRRNISIDEARKWLNPNLVTTWKPIICLSADRWAFNTANTKYQSKWLKLK
jgi:hypothetical protein